MNNFPENDTLYEFHNYGTSIKTREIFLHNYFGADNENPGVEYKMSNVFIKNLRKVKYKSYVKLYRFTRYELIESSKKYSVNIILNPSSN